MLALQHLMASLDPGTGRLLLGHLSGAYHGRKVAVNENDGNDDHVFWKFHVNCAACLEFEILSEESQSVERRLGFTKKGILGFGRDDEVNDQRLDSTFAFRSSDPPRFSVWVNSPQVKQSLTALSFHSFHITLRDGRIHFSMLKPDLLSIPDEVLRQLCNLALSAEQTFPYPPGASIPLISSTNKRLITYFIVGALLAAIVYYLSL